MEPFSRERVVVGSLLLIVLLAGLAWVGSGCIPGAKSEPVTAPRAFMEAQNAYLSAWGSYERAWLALPDTDPRKKQWVKDYHPKFVQAGELLLAWSATPDSYDSSADQAIAMAEDILIQLAIKKGGK